jgi:glycosyltransferase involved in cell wall biosynthesis
MEVVYGRSNDLPFDRVFTKYWNCDVLFLPSDWESFSLVFVEALACNKYIVSSSRVGALRLLLGKYSVADLESFGIFVSDHGAQAYARCLDRAAERVARRTIPTTRSLFDEFGFSRMRLSAELL